MATFHQLLSELKTGKPIRRKAWLPGNYIIDSPNSRFIPVFFRRGEPGSYYYESKAWNPYSKDFYANDWILYAQPSNPQRKWTFHTWLSHKLLP